MGKAIGIDLGTTNSCMAIMEGSDVKVIPNAEGKRVTPSVVAFTKEGERLVGEVAKNQAILNPERTIISVKRSMGTSKKFKIDDREYTPEEISAFILMKLKADAEAFLGEEIKDAVITVPAYFNDAQRKATKDAGRIAGFNVLRIINEPTAAALAYGLDKTDQEQTVMVYDLGGGTFDVSILELGEGVFEVKATAGDNHLGGDDFDQRIIDWLVEEFKAEEGIDLRNDPQAMQRLKREAERAKIELSSTTSTEINLPFITADASGPKHLTKKITRKQFEQMIEDLVEKTVQPMKQAMEDAGIGPEDLDQVLLVGGSTRIPMVQELVKKVTGKEPNRSINPDEVVAVGAAIQAAVLKGDVKDVLLLDVTPLSLGIETLGGVFTKIIERNTTIPTRKSEIFTTAADNQTSVEIKVYQGEREIARHNKFLGNFILTGIPPAPRGVPQIEVTFDIDANGILNVTAKDKATGREQSITITGSSNLSEEEVQRMMEEAKRHAEEDRKARERAEVHNNLDTLIYRTEKNLTEHGDKLPEAERKAVMEALEEAKSVLGSEDVERMKQAYEKLLERSYKLAEIMYRQAEGQAAGQTDGGTASAPGGGDEEVIEAEVVDEEEKQE